MAFELAQMTNLPLSQVEAALNALSTKLGSQSPITRLDETMSIRTRPIIALPDGRRLWTRPEDFSQGVLDWYQELCSPILTAKIDFDKSRQIESERIASDALARIFGASRTIANSTYASDGRPDADVLVSLPEAAIIVEVKGLLFTQKGRQGDPPRVRTKVKELVHKPIKQLNRAVEHLEGDPSSWRDSRGRRLGLAVPKKIFKVIVTLERVDSFGALFQGKRNGQSLEELEFDVWIVCLADLLAVIHILPTAHEMIAYLEARIRANKNGSPMVFMEMDFLSYWCVSRLLENTGEGEVLTLLGFQSDEMNLYFTESEFGPEVFRPTSSVPALIIDALDFQLQHVGATWLDCVMTVMSATSHDWASVHKEIQSISSAGATTRRKRKRRNRLLGGVSVGNKFVLQVYCRALPRDEGIDLSGPTLTILIDEFGKVGESFWRGPNDALAL
jgi:hypothetical protein